jgi:hypothetical protein
MLQTGHLADFVPVCDFAATGPPRLMASASAATLVTRRIILLAPFDCESRTMGSGEQPWSLFDGPARLSREIHQPPGLSSDIAACSRGRTTLK